MRKLTLLVMLALGLWACGDTGTSDARYGGVDLETHCRAWCEPETGCSELVQATPAQCLADCVGNAERDPCFGHVVTYQACMLAMECADPFEDCEAPGGLPRMAPDQDPMCEVFDNAYARCTCENLPQSGAGGAGGSGTAEPRLRNLVYCQNPDVAAPSCSIAAGYSMADDSALHAKLQTCAVGGCHATDGTAVSTWSLDMSGSVQNALAPLATVIGVNGDYLVDEFDPDCSYMLTKLTDQPAGGSRQPLTPPYWSSDEIDCFRSYLHDMSN